MRIQSADISRVILVRMDSGEDVLESLQAAVTEKNIANGFILNGVGSLTSYNVHVVETVNLPPGNLVFSDNGPFDILSITGTVLGGRVHAHITFSGLAAIAEMPDADLTDWDQI